MNIQQLSGKPDGPPKKTTSQRKQMAIISPRPSYKRLGNSSAGGRCSGANRNNGRGLPP